VFSGIIQELGQVRESRSGKLAVACDALASHLTVGDSVAVSGACLTVSAVVAGGFVADVMPETLHRTILGGLRSGDSVNLERALTLGDVVGGHLVTGHIDATGTVTATRDDGTARWITVEAPPQTLALLAEKGSVAIDGISLTVVDVFDTGFDVSLIPHTLRVTTAGGWQPGARVNLEVDIIARYVQRLLGARAQPALAEV